MRVDCATLVTCLPVATATADRIRFEPLPKGKLLPRAGDRAEMSCSGNLGNESTGTLIAVASETAARPAPFEAFKIVNQDENTRQDVLQSHEMIGHGPAGRKLKCRIPPASNVKKNQEFA